jgi:hypothetical protein
MRTLSPEAMPSGGLITTRSSAPMPDAIPTSLPRSRDRDFLERDARVVADDRDVQSALFENQGARRDVDRDLGMRQCEIHAGEVAGHQLAEGVIDHKLDSRSVGPKCRPTARRFGRSRETSRPDMREPRFAPWYSHASWNKQQCKFAVRSAGKKDASGSREGQAGHVNPVWERAYARSNGGRASRPRSGGAITSVWRSARLRPTI